MKNKLTCLFIHTALKTVIGKFLHRISHIDSQNGYSCTDNIFAVLIISSMSLYFHSRGTSFGIGVYVYLNHFN
mgnify:CR=1 FL=1